MRAFLTGLGAAFLAVLATLAVVFLRVIPQRDERRRKEAEAFAVKMAGYGVPCFVVAMIYSPKVEA